MSEKRSKNGRAPMPKLSAIEQVWEENEHLQEQLPNLRAYEIGWAEPLCFRCGWLPPCRAAHSYPASWKAARAIDHAWNGASGWLERAHLHDHAAGGSEKPDNLVPLCVLCHEEQPRCNSREEGIAFVATPPLRQPLIPFIQVWTDTHYSRISRPGKSSALNKMLRAQAAVARAYDDAARCVFGGTR